jgi:Single-strand binding protein family
MTEASVSFASNLTDDPEVRYTESGIARAMFRVAVSGRREQGEVVGRSFSTNSRPALRAAACGGRPRPATPRRPGRDASMPQPCDAPPVEQPNIRSTTMPGC